MTPYVGAIISQNNVGSKVFLCVSFVKLIHEKTPKILRPVIRWEGMLWPCKIATMSPELDAKFIDLKGPRVRNAGKTVLGRQSRKCW